MGSFWAEPERECRGATGAARWPFGAMTVSSRYRDGSVRLSQRSADLGWMNITDSTALLFVFFIIEFIDYHIFTAFICIYQSFYRLELNSGSLSNENKLRPD